MVTIEQIIEYLEKSIAEDFLSGNRVGLQRLQTGAGVLMSAAEASGDTETAYRLRVVASHAANKIEELEKNN